MARTRPVDLVDPGDPVRLLEARNRASIFDPAEEAATVRRDWRDRSEAVVKRRDFVPLLASEVVRVAEWRRALAGECSLDAAGSTAGPLGGAATAMISWGPRY